LDSNNIPYQDIDVGKDKAALNEMVNKSGALTTPVIEVDGEVFLGFNEKQLREKLGI
jgi:glutaredoxin 3